MSFFPRIMNWRGYWTAGTYRKGDTVLDGEWTMIANTETVERAAPQPTGPLEYISGLGDTPSWNSQSAVASKVITGVRFTIVNSGFITGVRVWMPAVDPNVYHRFSTIIDPLGNPEVSIGPTFQARGVGWIIYPIAKTIVGVGTVIDIILESQDTTNSTTFNGNWDYDTPGGQGQNPTTGEINHNSNAQDELLIHETDDDAGNRATELDTLKSGDTIEAPSNGVTYTVQNVADSGTFRTIGVTPASQLGTEGVQNFIFTVVTAASTDYVDITNHYLAVANIQGLFSTTGYSNVVADDNSYGVDVQVQAASISDEWDFISSSSAGGSPGGSGIGIGQSNVDILPTTVGTGNYTVLSTDRTILKSAITNGDTITLLESPAVGSRITITDASGTAAVNALTIDTTGAPLISGSATAVISQNYDSLTMLFDGTNYFIE